MAEFGTFVITNNGQALMAKLIANNATCNFTCIKTSSTVYQQSQLQALTALTNIKQSCDISSITRLNNASVNIKGALNNTELTAGYTVNTIGLYAKDPDVGEILYAVARATTAGYMPPYNSITSSGILFDFVITVGNATNVTVTINPAAVATQADVIAINATIADLAGFVGYTEDDIYGVEIDFANKLFTRLAGAVGKTPGADFDAIGAFGGRYRCNLTDEGVEVAKLGDAGYTETGKLIQAITIDETTYAVGTAVQTMVKQPKFYYKVVPLVLEKLSKGYKMKKGRFYMSMTPKAGFKLHPAFIHDGVEKDFIYLSAYEGSLYDVSASAYILDDAQVASFTTSTGDKLSSIANAKPISGQTQNLTRRNCGVLAENRGTGWYQQYAATIAASQILCTIEYAYMNSQSKIGQGVVSKTDDGATNMSEPTGQTALLGNASGMAEGQNGYVSITYRGEENIWGNIWKFTDGMNIYCDSENGVHDLYIADHAFAESKNTDNYKDAGITLPTENGYVSALAYSEEFDWLFVPGEVTGNSSLPVGDYFYQAYTTKGYKIAQLGGHWTDGGLAGAFYWYVYDAPSYRNRYVGGRLVYVPGVVETA